MVYWDSQEGSWLDDAGKRVFFAPHEMRLQLVVDGEPYYLCMAVREEKTVSSTGREPSRGMLLEHIRMARKEREHVRDLLNLEKSDHRQSRDELYTAELERDAARHELADAKRKLAESRKEIRRLKRIARKTKASP